MSGTDPDLIDEAYQHAKDSDEFEWLRVIYEVPYGEGWQDTEGYTRGELDGFLTVVREDGSEKIPGSRVIRVHTQEADDE